MVIVSLLPRAEFGRNDHREDAPHFIILYIHRSLKIEVKAITTKGEISYLWQR